MAVKKKTSKKPIKQSSKKTIKKTVKKTVKSAVKQKTTKTKSTSKLVSVKIYTTPTCPYCKMAKEYIKSKGVKYTEYDVSKDEKRANEMIEKSGQMGVPVLDIKGKIIVGFDRAE